jgi:hypothetical protein
MHLLFNLTKDAKTFIEKNYSLIHCFQHILNTIDAVLQLQEPNKMPGQHLHLVCLQENEKNFAQTKIQTKAMYNDFHYFNGFVSNYYNKNVNFFNLPISKKIHYNEYYYKKNHKKIAITLQIHNTLLLYRQYD